MNDYDIIKRKIRQLKKIEIKIRFGTTEAVNLPAGSILVWNTFFDLSHSDKSEAKYTFDRLCTMDRKAFRTVLDEFFFHVYYRFYKENGIASPAFNVYDPEILSHLGLPPDADYTAVKKKFRELALKYHPDTGGDAEQFIKLMENYKKLTGG